MVITCLISDSYFLAQQGLERYPNELAHYILRSEIQRGDLVCPGSAR